MDRYALVMRLKGCLAGLLLALSANAAATTRYVSPAGSDTNAGTEAAPFATIQKGVDASAPGDTVSVADGTYGPNGHYTCGDVCSQSGYAAPVTMGRSGTPSAPITLAAQHKWGAILDCGLPEGYAGDGTDGVKACDTYFDFKGLASYITISGFDIRGAYWVGAMVNATNTHINFLGNHFHNIGNRTYTVPAGTSGFGIAGVYAGASSAWIAWDGNQFDHIGRLPHPGAMVDDDYSHDHGLYLNNGPYSVTNNIFYNQAGGWNLQTALGLHDLLFLNNTLICGFNPVQDGCMMLWGHNTNVTIQNNIFYNGRNYAIAAFSSFQEKTLIDHNLVYGSPSGLIAPVRGRISEVNNYFGVDPLFVSLAGNDYHLLQGSPAIDSGASVPVPFDFDGNQRPIGPAFDIGAFEFTIP
jgi:hypothetical protein